MVNILGVPIFWIFYGDIAAVCKQMDAEQMAAWYMPRVKNWKSMHISQVLLDLSWSISWPSADDIIGACAGIINTAQN